MYYEPITNKIREKTDGKRVEFIYGRRKPIVGKRYSCITFVKKENSKVLKAKKIRIENAERLYGNVWIIKNSNVTYLLQVKSSSKINVGVISKMPKQGKRIFYHKVWGDAKKCMCEISKVENYIIINKSLIEIKSNKEVYICILV